MRLSFHLVGFSILACAAFVGCTQGGQTGDLSGEHDMGNGQTGGENSNCKDERTELADFDKASVLGFSANDILAFAETTFESRLVWKELSSVQYSPESGESAIQLEIERGDKAYYVTSVPKDNEGGGEIEISCAPPHIEIDVHASLSTDGGAFDESFDTTLKATAADVAELVQSFDLDELSGSFAIDQVTPDNGEFLGPAFEATLMPEGMTGSFSGSVQVTTDDAVSMGGVGELGVFPDESACLDEQLRTSTGIAVGADDEALGWTESDALDALAESGPVEIEWMDGSQTELTLTATATGDGCVRAGEAEGSDSNVSATVSYPVELRATTADGRLDGTYSARLVTWRTLDERGLPDDGHGLNVSVRMQLDVAQAGDSGFSDIEVPDGQDNVGFQIFIRVADGEEPSGNMTLNGLAEADCVKNPPPCSENGCPGCEGTHVTELEAASWGADQ